MSRSQPLHVAEPTACAMRLAGVEKRFGDLGAVRGLSLSVAEGQFLALLGPSGCGKTTTLRLLAGLEAPDRGEIWLGDRLVAGPRAWVPPEARRIGMVFQDYALFPHLNVGDNIAFPLKGRPRADRRRRVAELVVKARLQGLEERYPHQLSGGQQQRVALARALAAEPTLVLLDEPFSNLDAALRESTRSEVREILHRADATTILVTHDWDEALSLADRVAVMLEGRVSQVGEPREIYLRPVSREVARCMGAAHFIDGQAEGDHVRCALGVLPLACAAEGAVTVLLRPEALRLVSAAKHGSDAVARIVERRLHGPYQAVRLALEGGTTLEAHLAAHEQVRQHERCAIEVRGKVMAYPLAATTRSTPNRPTR